MSAIAPDQTNNPPPLDFRPKRPPRPYPYQAPSKNDPQVVVDTIQTHSSDKQIQEQPPGSQGKQTVDTIETGKRLPKHISQTKKPLIDRIKEWQGSWGKKRLEDSSKISQSSNLIELFPKRKELDSEKLESSLSISTLNIKEDELSFEKGGWSSSYDEITKLVRPGTIIEICSDKNECTRARIAPMPFSGGGFTVYYSIADTKMAEGKGDLSSGLKCGEIKIRILRKDEANGLRFHYIYYGGTNRVGDFCLEDLNLNKERKI